MNDFENIELEQIILSAILNLPEGYHRWDLKESDFSDEFHKRLFIVIGRCLEEGIEVNPVVLRDKVTIKDKMESDKYLSILREISVTLIDIRGYVRALKELSQKREFFDACVDAKEKLETELDCSTEDIFSNLEKIMFKHSDNAIGYVQNSEDVTATIAKNLEENSRPDPTGIKVLDEAMFGGLYKKRSYFFAAAPKQGKTMLQISMAYNLVKQNISVLFVACEMGREEIHQRFIARDRGFNSVEFLLKDKKEKNIDDCFNFLKDNKKLPIHYVDAAGITLDKLKRVVVLCHKKYGINGFFLDYLQLVKGKPASISEAEHIKNVAQWCAEICKKLNIWCVVSAQLNRDGQVKGSNGAMEAADQLYHLHKFEHKYKNVELAYLDMIASRYTLVGDLGTEEMPSLIIDKNGAHYRDFEGDETYHKNNY